ncbi:MAG: tetratricopeptide repeat protein, partial [Planctomycetales bacterium]|nr:tetratricopeptide repeat protein [Planctomycetales bacterium]
SADRFGFLDYQFGPSNDDDANPTVTQLLARGRARLDSELKDQPVVRAALTTRIAQVYLSLGDFREVDALLQSALATQREHQTDVAATDLIETLMTLGVVRYVYGYYDAAVTYLQEAVELGNEAYGELDPRGANAKLLFAMVTMESSRSDYEQRQLASRTFRQVVTIRESEPTHSGYDLAHAYLGQAIVARVEGDFAGALISLGKAGSQLLTLPGGSDYLQAWTLGIRAAINWQAKNNQVAYQQTEQLLQQLRDLLGERHPAVTHIQIDFATRMVGAGETQKAEAYLREATARAREVYGRQPRTASALHILGNLLANRDDQLAEAKSLLHESWEIYNETLGAENQRTIAVAKTLAKLNRQ